LPPPILGRTKAVRAAGARSAASFAIIMREYKQEFRQGNCKIERKWERDGGYKEEVKCKGRR
jgi:hypothetical protein